MREFFVLHRMVGRTPGVVLTPGYFEPCNFPSDCSMPGFPVHHRPTPPRAYSNSCPLSLWCHPTISSSVVPFSSCLQSFPASESFQMSQFFTSGGQSIGVSASESALSMNIQDWFPLGLTWTNFKKRISYLSCKQRFLCNVCRIFFFYLEQKIQTYAKVEKIV